MRLFNVFTFGLLYATAILALELVAIVSGTQGVDYAIFVQVVKSVVHTGQPISSLIGFTNLNFMTHHFSPYLVLFGDLAFALNLSAESVLLMAHFVACFFIVYLLNHFAHERGVSSALSLGLTALIVLSPAVRIPLAWEVRDEIYAAPLLLLGACYLSNGRYLKMAIALSYTLLFKETFGLFILAFAIAGIVRGRREQSFERNLALALWGVAGAAFFLFYAFYLQRYVFSTTFEIASRLNFQAAFDLSVLTRKFHWIIKTFYPIAFFAVFSGWFFQCRSCWKILLCNPLFIPAGVSCGVIFISSFPAMYHPFNYYGVIPYLMVSIWIISSIGQALAPKIGRVLIPSLVFALFIPQPLRYSIDLSRSINRADEALNISGQLIADDYLSSKMLDYGSVMRVYHANRSLPKFDYILIRGDIKVPLSLYLRSWSSECFRDANLIVRCAHPSARPR